MKKISLTLSLVIFALLFLIECSAQQLDQRGVPVQVTPSSVSDSLDVNFVKFQFGNFELKFETDSCSLSPDKITWEMNDVNIVLKYEDPQRGFLVGVVPVYFSYDYSVKGFMAKVYETPLGHYYVIFDRRKDRYIAVVQDGLKNGYPIINK